MLKKIFTNPAILYVISRYATYSIQFVNSLFIALYLGPVYLGIWGFIQLIIQYVNQLNLGIPHSVNIIISIKKKNEVFSQKIIGNAILMLLLLSLFIICVFFISRYFDFGNKYNFEKYTIPVCIIGILGYYNSLFFNIFRIYNKITVIAFNQSLFPILMLIAIFLFKGNDLLWALVFSNLISSLITFCIFIIQSPIAFKFMYNARVIQVIQKKGWHLFIYNTCFYLIILTARLFISGYYSIEEFGFFTFAHALAHSILLFLEAISYLIFPKMINRFASYPNSHIIGLLSSIRSTYITFAHGIVHLSIFAYPFFLYFFSKYESTFAVFSLTALTIVLYTNAFGYSGLLQARHEEKLLSYIALIAFIANISFLFVSIIILKVSYEYAILATMLSYLLYVLILGIYGRKSLSLHVNCKNIAQDIFPFRIIFPLGVSVILIVLKISHLFFLVPLSLFLLLNYKHIVGVKGIVKQFVNNPNFINI